MLPISVGSITRLCISSIVFRMLILTLGVIIESHAANSGQSVHPKSRQIIKIIYFSQLQSPPVYASNLDPFVPNKGEIAAQLAINDNNTTGQFTGQDYQLIKVMVPHDADLIKVYLEKVPSDAGIVVLNVSSGNLSKLSDLPVNANRIILDASSTDDVDRGVNCRKNVFHMLPARSMKADALAQFLLKKRWQKWFLVVGQNPEDQLFTQALKRAAKRYNHKIIEEKTWSNASDVRRTVQSEVPVFTQLDDDYDVLVVADEQGLFGEYFDYRTWSPRPVAGTQGLVPSAWHQTHELWGATQLQNRFKDQAGRQMQEVDYGSYMAVRAVGEAATRTKSDDPKIMAEFMLSDGFALQGYKGVPLSFRQWDRQLRQPVLLSGPRSAVAVAPIEGFLHPKSELDTLGFDQAESLCK